MYLVTFEGYYSSYGTEKYAGGIFSSEDLAKEAAEKINAEIKKHFDVGNATRIIEFDLNKADMPDDFDNCECSNSHYLGGYIE